jgi:DNA topoisomerase-3
MDRRSFEILLGGLAAAGLVRVLDDSFEKAGRLIHFQRASLTAEGYREGPAAAARVSLAQQPAAAARKRGKRSEKGAKPPKPTRAREERFVPGAELSMEEPLPGLVEALKAWRRVEAQRRKVPAFRILTDRALTALATARPDEEAELLNVPGIGPGIVGKYGREILQILREGA